MFVRNFSSIPLNSIVLVDADAKKYLESIGFCVLSSKMVNLHLQNQKICLIKLSLWKGGKAGG